MVPANSYNLQFSYHISEFEGENADKELVLETKSMIHSRNVKIYDAYGFNEV